MEGVLGQERTVAKHGPYSLINPSLNANLSLNYLLRCLLGLLGVFCPLNFAILVTPV